MRGVEIADVRIALGLGIVICFAAGCASKQRLDLHCVPQEVTVYVDGRKLDGVPEALKLRKDRPHTVFFKGGGFESQMVVLESREDGEEIVLQPADLCSQTTFVSMKTVLQLQVDEAPAPSP